MILRLFVIMCFLLPVAVSAAPTLQDVRVEAGEVLERVAFSFDQRIEYKDIFTLENPDRLVIDVPALRRVPALDFNRNYGGNLLKNLRVGRFNETTSRIVCDLHKGIEVKNIYLVTPTQGEEWQLVVDIAPKGAVIAPTDAVQTAAPKPKPKPRKPIIVIDAGHGGKDPGAVGRSGLYEKEIVLAYARALEKALLRTGRYRTVMTRSGDRFIRLGDRVKKARAAKGDVFISLHADSNPNKDARGFSVYTVSEKASDAESAALARRENKADIIDGFDFEEEDEDVANILIDLATRATKNRASRLAETVVAEMSPKVTLLPNPHRFAGFRVLKAPDIPSILIELGFLSNRQDEKLLQSREYQARMVEGILAGLDRYFAEYAEE